MRDTAVAENEDIGNIVAKPGRKTPTCKRPPRSRALEQWPLGRGDGNGYNSTNQRPVLLVQYPGQQQTYSGCSRERTVATGRAGQ